MSTRRYEVGVGLLVAVGLCLLGYMALQVGAFRGFNEHKVQASVLLDNVAGLSVGAVVSVAGVPVGNVESLTIDLGKARTGLSLDTTANIRTDAIVAMRARSILGEKYLELVPQSTDAPLVKSGDVLTHTEGQIEIDQLVNQLGPMLGAIDPAALNEALTLLTAALKEDPERPKRMLADSEKLLHNLAVASDELPALILESRATLASVKRTSDEARPLIGRLSGAAVKLDALVAAIPPEDLPALLTEVHDAVKDGRAILEKLDSTSGSLNRLLTKADEITRDDLLRLLQEDGVYVRLRPRTVEDARASEHGGWKKK